jgi:hypothetical protein
MKTQKLCSIVHAYDSLVSRVRDRVELPIRISTKDSVGFSVQNSVGSSIWEYVYHSVRNSMHMSVGNSVYRSMRKIKLYG